MICAAGLEPVLYEQPNELKLLTAVHRHTPAVYLVDAAYDLWADSRLYIEGRVVLIAKLATESLPVKPVCVAGPVSAVASSDCCPC